jgi:hypothetical protein
MLPCALNLLVFREARRRVHGAELKSALLQELADFSAQPSPDRVVTALLRAGELECGVSDADETLSAQYSKLTDRLAEALLDPGSWPGRSDLARILINAGIPDEVSVSPPEGFAYYALHPLAFAEVVERIPMLSGSVLVIGIRSIGTTLSAVTKAAARKRGVRAQRITVRPAGHPYNRRTTFSPEQVDLIRQSVSAGAAFLVVDEGPGLSGSSFLSVAEALEEAEAGAPREKIMLICGHQPDFDSLRADDGPRRARRFRWIAASSGPRRPAGADVFIGGGKWRQRFFADQRAWPASWTSLERLKYLPACGGTNAKLFKFLGFGHYGQQVFEREEQVAARGFGPPLHRESEGFASYRWIGSRVAGCGLHGRPMSAGDLSARTLERLAAYCAFRAQAFAAEVADLGALEQMAEHNAGELGIDLPVALKIERPAVSDGRMQPHDWLLTTDDDMLKTDSGGHGDDHFLPGPTDIAWDLAGAIVEWHMNAAQTEFFLEAYRRASGDDPRFRIPDFMAAYSVFRCAYCLMAGNALHGNEEQARLERAANDHRVALLHLVSSVTPVG